MTYTYLAMAPCSCDSILQMLSPKEAASVQDACAFAEKYLSTLRRRTGEAYAAHGCEVAKVLRELTDDASLLKIAVLHDILVHPDGAEYLARAPLAPAERELVKKMHELRRLHIDADTHDLDRVLDAFLSDSRMLVLRMAHRVNDIRHLDRFDKRLRAQIARETLHMYTSIAGRLGFHKWRYEMEDVCFLLLYPKAAEELQTLFTANESMDRACLKHAEKFINVRMDSEKIPAVLDGRIKGLYSTYRKMVLKNRKFQELTDRLALRIIVPVVGDCYRALGIVHSCMHAIPGKLKDYIGIPKENGYRSIHTVVYPLPGVTEQPIEIQIRTEQMHRECEQGTSAHHTYADWKYALRTRPARVNLFRNLENLRAEARSPQEFERALRTYFREDHVMLFDAKNRLYHLRKPLTVLDFAFAAYGKRCRSLKSAKVNGRHSSLDTQLHDGDIVDVEFGRGMLIRGDWMHACKHTGTKKMLRELVPLS